MDLDIIVGLKYYQQAKFLTLSNHMAFPAVLFTSQKWWDSLPPGDQDLIKKAYHEAGLWGIDTQVKAEATNLEKLKQDGAVVVNVDLGPFKEKGKPVSENYINKNALIKQFAIEVSETIKK